MSTIKQKTETELQKRLIKSQYGSFYQSYVPNILSITSAEKLTNGTITSKGVITIISCRVLDGSQCGGTIKRNIKGTLKQVLDSWEITSLKYENYKVRDQWKWFELL